jgi:ribonuclease Y
MNTGPGGLMLVALAGSVLGYAIQAVVTRLRMASAQRHAADLRAHAEREAEVLLREARLQAKDEVLRAREGFEQEALARRQELRTMEERLGQREGMLDRKVDALDQKERLFDDKIHRLEQEQQTLDQKETELNQLLAEERRKLQQVANLPPEEARRLLMQNLEEELRAESAALIRRVQEEAQETAEREARKIIVMAIERYAADQVNEMTTSAVTLPNDDMKGRIIGREGRNIRALEAATGVNVLIDDTPEVVVVSAFDPLRREVARQALERLVADGRIHPTRIEEVVTKVQSEVEEMVRNAGEQAVYELGLPRVDPEVIHMLGRLRFRHSYGQNVLQHSLEMAYLMGMMASELGLDPALAKRCGLLHDIGKAMDHDQEGSHALLGAEFLRAHEELPVVVNAVAAHHNEVEPESPYAALVKAADAITAARPGARQEHTEIYLKRLEKLEEIAGHFRGVDKCYAIQAGREIRVLVEPSKIDDDEALQMARNISKQIEAELQYPGQIKVTVVRETRCVEYAK